MEGSNEDRLSVRVYQKAKENFIKSKEFSEVCKEYYHNLKSIFSESGIKDEYQESEYMSDVRKNFFNVYDGMAKDNDLYWNLGFSLVCKPKEMASDIAQMHNYFVLEKYADNKIVQSEREKLDSDFIWVSKKYYKG
jgi:hypothetical protein